MDCLEAREIISEAFDRGIADTPQAAQARKHCRTCKECRTFVEGLALLQKTPPPAAPPELIDGIVERGRKMAEAGFVGASARKPAADTGTEAPSAESAGAAPFAALEPVARPKVRDGWWWGTRIAASVVVLLVAASAVSLASQGFRALKHAGGAAPTAGVASAPSDPGSYRLQQGAPKATDAATNGASEATAMGHVSSAAGARYVDLGGIAYVWIGERTPDPASLEEAGRLTSSLDGSDSTSYEVWRSKTDAGVVFIRPDSTSETYVGFRAVYRSVGGKPYTLSVGRGVPGYAAWPSLPSDIETPTAADGSPSLAKAGTDDTGLAIYTPGGTSPAAGFAVAPGTAGSDPAAGSPNWTWWVPKP